MKYTFEVTTNENINTISVNIAYGSMNNMVSRTISFDDENYNIPSLNDLIKEMVDNLRLTVKEREEAIHNTEVLQWYLQKFGVNKQNEETPNSEQIILEN